MAVDGQEQKAGHRRARLGLVATAVVCGAAVFIPAISWRPEGGMTSAGLALSLGSIGALVLAVVYAHWRLYPLRVVICPLAFIAFVFLHNASYAVRQIIQARSILQGMIGGLEVGTFLAAVLLCPAAFFVGLGGSSLGSLRLARSARSTRVKVLAALSSLICAVLLAASVVFMVARMR